MDKKSSKQVIKSIRLPEKIWYYLKRNADRNYRSLNSQILKISSKSKSFGIRIDLPFEATPNEHLDIKFYHKRFSSRLDEFMRISHAVVVTPGGIGTLLELLYTWQLIQVNHISARPIILVGDMWNGFFDWIKSEPLKAQLLDKADLDNIIIVKNVHEVTKLLKPEIKAFYVNKFKSKS